MTKRHTWLRTLGVIGATAGALAACSSPSGTTTSTVDLPSASGTDPAPGGTKTLAVLEGSYDSASGTLSFAFRDPSTGDIQTETTFPNGTAAGDGYLHTCGTHGDGYTNSVFSPPTYNGTCSTTYGVADAVCFELSYDNGTGAARTGITVNMVSIAPSTVLIASNPTNGGTCQYTGSHAVAAPCTFGVGNGSFAKNASFPALGPACNGTTTSTIAGFDNSAIGGGNFSFQGIVTGT